MQLLTLNTATIRLLIAGTLVLSMVLSNFSVALIARAEGEGDPPAPPTCDEGQHLDGDVCVDDEPDPPSCADDEELVENECVLKTPPSSPDDNTGDNNEGDEGDNGPDGDPVDPDPAQNGDNGGDANDNASTTPSGDNNAGDGGAGGTGQTGTSTDEMPEPDGAPAIIDTGNATSSSSGATGANLTDIDTNATSSATSTESTASSTCLVCTPQGGGATDASVNNTLSASTTASSTASTGDNFGIDPDGVIIETGNGAASVFDILAFNIALVNSVGEILIYQNPLASELDMRSRIQDVFAALTGEPGHCTLLACKTADAMFTYAGDNLSDVERNTYAGCNSGYNGGVSSDGPVLIDTGDCVGSNLTVTIGNLTAVESRYLILLMNHLGDMQGNILLSEASFFEALRGGAALGGGSDLAATSTLDVVNNATSTASSGTNVALGDTFSGIETGDADAHAFVGNYGNQINPPICFIISVGGEWSGDVYQLPEGFDREATPYADIICGRGGGASAAPTDLHLSTVNYAKVLVNAIAEATTGGNLAKGGAAAIKTGDAESFLFVLNLLNTTLINQDWMFGLFTVSGDWDGSLYFGTPPAPTPAEQAAGQIISGTKSQKKKAKAPSADVTLTKVAQVDTTASPTAVHYTITLKNNGSKLYKAVLEDVLSNPADVVMNQQKWELGTVLAGEEVTVAYSVEFAGTTLPGEYLNAVRLTARRGSDTGVSVQPVYTSATVNLAGEVLAYGDCPAYLTKYISPGGLNDPEQVKLLEVFLRDGRGEAITPDGTYDNASIEAVRAFQREYSGDVLSPWGIGFATGHVYYTTQKKINELYCGGDESFALSQGQLAEITYYKEFVLGQGPLAPGHIGDTPGPSLTEMFNLDSDRIVESAPYFYPSRRGGMLTILETFFSWMRYLATIPEASARGN